MFRLRRASPFVLKYWTKIFEAPPLAAVGRKHSTVVTGNASIENSISPKPSYYWKSSNSVQIAGALKPQGTLMQGLQKGYVTHTGKRIVPNLERRYHPAIITQRAQISSISIPFTF